MTLWLLTLIAVPIFLLTLILLVIGVGDVAEELRELRKGWERRP